MTPATVDEREELAQILFQAGTGNQQAFAELYRRTSSKLFGVCLRMLRDRSDAEEVLQEVFTTVWRRAASFDAARASAITWLVTLTRNKAIDRLRQHREQLQDSPDSFEVVDENQPSPAQTAQSSQERRQLEQCMDALEPQQKSAVREAFFSGATYNELAVRCQVPLGTMKSWIRRSLMRLKACLENA
jgi:RNA polymerase sigma-70 factor (ECF subfamily)